VVSNVPEKLRDLGFVAYVRDARHPDGSALSCSWHQSLLDAERIATALNDAELSMGDRLDRLSLNELDKLGVTVAW